MTAVEHAQSQITRHGHGEHRQRARLDGMVSCARTHSPYYRELYRDLPERIEAPTRLPVTGKKELMAQSVLAEEESFAAFALTVSNGSMLSATPKG